MSAAVRHNGLIALFLGAAVVGGWYASRERPLSGLGSARAQENIKRVKAPDKLFEGGVAWINTANPIKLADLKGKIVVLDFWTFCCINCIHTLPDLAKLEKKYAKEVVVIGVHSAKFDNEKVTENIRKAVNRYRIAHPVVNDANMAVWNSIGIESWPTLAVIDPEGYFVYADGGEGQYDAVAKTVDSLIEKYKGKGLNEEPMRFDLAKSADPAGSPLYFPGKLLADAATDRLFIADSTNNRVVVTDLGGKRVAVAGTGVAGKADGPFTQAQFDDPQGLALDGDTLYVADRKNHLIRALDLKGQTVRTVAGTGEQDRGSRFRGGEALKVGLNSPWDLLRSGRTLYIAMAGHHQIWTINLDSMELSPYAGNGRENIRDGALRDANFAQPSGLTTDGRTLYVADSEVSAVRALPLADPKGEVTTLVGEGLFKFGDADGTGRAARLQHALAVAWHDGKLIVADTYNSKLKTLDPATKECKTFLSEGGGWLEGRAFNEPAGLSVANGKLYVADTNAHRVRVVDLATKALTTLPLTGVEPVKRN
jgi:DNA-binding beta-propeller fold protein YncE